MFVQRWRVIYRRGPDAPDLSQREQSAAWTSAIEQAGFRSDGVDAPKLVFALPLSSVTADHDQADLFLGERRTSADVRGRLIDGLPTGHDLVDLHDVWVGEPALPGQVVAVDYDVHAVPDADVETLSAGVTGFTEAATVERVRRDGTVGGNLRPFVEDVRALGLAALRMRVRVDAELGTARPEEVVAAVGRFAGIELTVERRHRLRTWLRDEVRPPLG